MPPSLFRIGSVSPPDDAMILPIKTTIAGYGLDAAEIDMAHNHGHRPSSKH